MPPVVRYVGQPTVYTCTCDACPQCWHKWQWEKPLQNRTTEELWDVVNKLHDDYFHRALRVECYVHLYHRAGVHHPEVPDLVWTVVFGDDCPPPSLLGRLRYCSRMHRARSAGHETAKH